MVYSSIMDPVMKYLDIWWYLRKRKRKNIYEKAMKNPKGHTINEIESFKTFEGIFFDMSWKYASNLKIMFITIFYASMLPHIVPVGILSITLTYWAEKYLLLRRSQLPTEMGKDLIRSSVDMLNFLPLIHTLGTGIMYRIA